jgi:hypothetical protein
LVSPEIISVESIAYNEVEIKVKRNSQFAETVMFYRRSNNGDWLSSSYYFYEDYMIEAEDTIVTLTYYDNTLHELELLRIYAENLLDGEFYSYTSAPIKFGGIYTLLKHPVIDTMIRSENDINLIWSLQSEYADSVLIKRKKVDDSSEPEILTTILASDTSYTDSEILNGEDYIYYLTAFNDSVLSKQTVFNTYIYTSVEPDVINNKMLLYPNPVSSELFSNIPKEYHNSEVAVKVYSLSGKLIEQIIENNTNRIRLDVNHLTRGIYIVEINSNSKKQFQKMVKD